MDIAKPLKDFFENTPLYTPLRLEGREYLKRTFRLKEIQADCETCEQSKPFHNWMSNDQVILLEPGIKVDLDFSEFRCVTCGKGKRSFWIRTEQVEASILETMKIGQYPQKELPRSKSLGKFFKEDKQEYNKAVICLAHGYGVAAFAYMRRVVEKNINSLLDLIQESIEPESQLVESLGKLKITSPMSDKIEIANHALPDYLKPDGFNPLGQIYGILSDGVHSLPDNECLDKAQDLQACLEFLISELATHKKNREEFKNRLNALRKK